MSAGPPTFSILLLCWNHAPYLAQCIGAIARQEREAIEVLFLDNGSSDGSLKLAERLFAEHGIAATMLANDKSAGISANFNRLLAASRGELVSVLSTDDWYEPDYVAAMRQAAAADPSAGWFACGGWLFFEDSGTEQPIDDADFCSGQVLDQLLAGANPFNFVGCCYRRSALTAAGGWDDQLPIEDRDLFVRLAQRHPVRALPERLVHYRRASSTASANPDFMARGWHAFFAKHRTLFGAHWRSSYAALLQGTAASAVDQGNLRLARTLLGRALRLDPTNGATWRTAVYWLRRRLRAGV